MDCSLSIACQCSYDLCKLSVAGEITMPIERQRQCTLARNAVQSKRLLTPLYGKLTSLIYNYRIDLYMVGGLLLRLKALTLTTCMHALLLVSFVCA
jgi:hypothetical protein